MTWTIDHCPDLPIGHRGWRKGDSRARKSSGVSEDSADTPSGFRLLAWADHCNPRHSAWFCSRWQKLEKILICHQNTRCGLFQRADL